MPTPGGHPDQATGVTRFHLSTFIPRTHLELRNAWIRRYRNAVSLRISFAGSAYRAIFNVYRAGGELPGSW
jgi:hypothetical protein